MAFFQWGARPTKGVRLRRALPRTFKVLTRRTLTLKSSWMAWRISVLLARRSATTVYWLKASDWRVPFSVTRTVLMISKEVILFLGQPLLDEFEGAAGENEFVTAQDLIGVEGFAGGDFDLAEIAGGEATL